MCLFRIVEFPLTNVIKGREDGTVDNTESGGVAADNTRRVVSGLS